MMHGRKKNKLRYKYLCKIFT